LTGHSTRLSPSVRETANTVTTGLRGELYIAVRRKLGWTVNAAG
jgi:hypothetical protein